MSHLTIANLEAMLAVNAKAADPARRYVYVETGRYKSFMPVTVKAAERRGHTVDMRCGGVFYVYPKGVEATTAKTLDMIKALARTCIDHGKPTERFQEDYDLMSHYIATATFGELRRKLGDALCMSAAPCVKVEKILALVA